MKLNEAVSKRLLELLDERKMLISTVYEGGFPIYDMEMSSTARRRLSYGSF